MNHLRQPNTEAPISAGPKNTVVLWSFVALALVYLAGVLAIFSPYRFFPTDDFFFQWPFLNRDLSVSFEEAITSYQPVFKLTLLAIKMLWAFLGQELTPSIFIFTSGLASSVIMLSLMLSVHVSKRQGFFPLLVGLVFALSSWAATYFCFFSYGPMSSAYCMASIALLLMSSRERTKAWVSFSLCAGAGLLMGLYFWSSPSGAVLAGLALLLPFFIWEGQLRRRVLALVIFGVSEVLVIAAFGVNSLPTLLAHVQANIYDNWCYTVAQANPAVYEVVQDWNPLFSFFQIALKVHAPITTLLFLGVVVLTVVAHYASKRTLFAGNKATRAGMVMAGYFLAAGLLIDLLATTKLGRSLFQLYPLMLLATFLLAGGLISNSRLSAAKRRLCLGALLSLCLAGVMVDGVRTRDLYLSRFALPNYLQEHFAGKPIYLLDVDNHAKWIAISCRPEFDIRIISVAEMQALLNSTREEVGILLGPTEKNSSMMSIYLDPHNRDIFQAEIDARLPALQKIQPVFLPFSALHPAFLMENEATQALSFLGLAPAWNTPASGLKLFRVKGAP